MRPTSFQVRMYDCGYGDCFLVTVCYPSEKRHLLVDFGTTQRSHQQEQARLIPIAEDIRRETGGKLHAIVASHRHRDHIGGFAVPSRGPSAGAIIRDLQPHAVLQPWTEDPRHDAPPASMTLAPAILRLLDRTRLALHPVVEGELRALAEGNLPNQVAVESLRRLGTKRLYLKAGDRTGLEELFPGLSFQVLGPSGSLDAAGWATLNVQRESEAWRVERLMEVETAALERTTKDVLFPNAKLTHPCLAPPSIRWFLDRVLDLRAEQLLALARVLDARVNNTSLILMIQGAGHQLLFPGDVELDGWARALQTPAVRAAVQGTTLYKVSHHGGGSGTPRSVWSLFAKRSTPAEGSRLVTMLSTKGGIHGTQWRGTEIPRRALVDQMRGESLLVETPECARRRRKHWTVELPESGRVAGDFLLNDDSTTLKAA